MLTARRRHRRIRAFTLIEVMIVAAILASLTAVATPNLLAGRRTANQSAARANLKNLATSAEVASTKNGGIYPADVTELRQFIPSASSFCVDGSGTVTAVNGYSYSCSLAGSGYTFIASPTNSGVTGSVTYTATTGGVLTPL